MIRTTNEAPFFGLWRDSAVFDQIAHPPFLTTARYEPILRRQLGSGQIDLLFESPEMSCIIGGIRLDAATLITRERSPFIWPVHLAQAIDHATLAAIERKITPWLRSIARAGPMARESIRRFTPSDRFDRARGADLVGAASLDRTLPRMAPFVYARRFAKDARVKIACANAALAQAVLADVAAVVSQAEGDSDDEAFARSWYGLTPFELLPVEKSDLVITDRRGDHSAAVVVTIEFDPPSASGVPVMEIPAPAPWDLLFSFDTADAPAAGRFSVNAREPLLREEKLLAPARLHGGSSGTVVLVTSPEAQTARGPELEEPEILGQLLAAEGFRVHFTTNPADPALIGADLVHIFGAPTESHTVEFGEVAAQHGVPYVFDLPPKPADPSAFFENALTTLLRAALDDADIARYMKAYEQRHLDAAGSPEPGPEHFARIESRFFELAQHAVAVLTVEEDLDVVRAALPAIADRVSARGVFAQAEPVAAPIGHLVPAIPFAFVHALIGARSHALYAALAAERLGIPIVIAGPVYDVDYLQTLRAASPSAIVLADADPCTISALYRRSAVWVDPAPRPLSAARLLRALACGALPVVAAESPLSRLVAGGAPVFPLTAVDECARTIAAAIRSVERTTQVDYLAARLLERRDPTQTFGSVLKAYSRIAATV